MARLIPKISIEDIRNKPERDVARPLVEGLLDDCLVYHSYPWLRAERHDRDRQDILREGEADFVVVDPSLGILILEVKGGAVGFDGQAHEWFRQLDGGRRKPIQDPFEQARRNTHHLEEQIRRNSFPGQSNIPCAYGCAVVFPDCVYSGPLPPGAEHSIVLSSVDLPYLGRRLPDILRQWIRSRGPRPLAKDELDGVVKGLSPSFQLLPVLFRQVEEQEEWLFRLTEEQMRLLDFLAHHRRAAVEGVAGSGKTVLARAQAQRFADAGKTTLLVCYNKALAEWLRSSQPEGYQDKIVIRHFHGLCTEWCREASIPFPVPGRDQDRFWRYDAPELLFQAIERVPRRFDAVVVDEGQDFYPEWWIPLQEINAEGDEGPFYVFYDPKQNLFVEDRLTIPIPHQPFVLPTNCRNTRQIAETCSRVRGIEIRVRPDAPEGAKCDLHFAPSAQRQQRLGRQYIDEWIGKGRLKPSQVAILWPHDKARSSFAPLDTIGRVPLTTDPLNLQQGKGILFATIRSFKGLEADAVLMVDVVAPGSLPHFSQADFYVGCSRAKHLLAILAMAPGVV